MGKKGHSYPGVFGDYKHYDENGNKTGYSEPDIFGGYTNYDENGKKVGHSEPDIFGGYTHYDENGKKIGHSDRDVFDGLTHYDGDGKKVGSSQRDIFGGYSNDSSEGCYIATCVYGSYDCPEVMVLRRFRDNKLSKSFIGRLFIKVYYAVSPKIVKCFGNVSLFKRFWKKRLDRMVNSLKEKGF